MFVSSNLYKWGARGIASMGASCSVAGGRERVTAIYSYGNLAIRCQPEDLGHSGSEQRYFCFGFADGGVMTVRFTYRGSRIRIIAAGYWRKGKTLYEQENSQIHRR